VDFKGDDVLKPAQLRHALKFKTGDIFDADDYQKTLMELYTAYQDIGHLHVRIADEKTTRADSIIDITYDINEGLPSHVNLVNIVGNTKTKDHVIRREISMLPGQVFNRELVIRSARDIMALNYFSNVLPDPIDLPNGDVNLEFKIEEKQTGQISAGAGYNSQDKLVGNIGMGIPNLAGNGQNLSFSVDFGSRLSSFSISFTEPWLFGRPTSLGAEIFTQNRRWYDDYTEGRQGGSIRLGRRLRWPDNYFRIYGSYGLERNRFFDFSDNFLTLNSYRAEYYWDKTPDKILDSGDTLMAISRYGELPGSVLSYQERWLTASRVSFTLTRDSRNLPEFATKGSDIVYTFESTGGFLGGFWHYQRHLLQLSKFIPVLGNIALATKVQYGVVTSPSGDSSILVTDRFSPGGVAFDGIVRGYDDGSLTPDTILTQPAVDSVYLYADSARAITHPPLGANDTLLVSSSGQARATVRGKYMLVTNIELQIPLVKQQLYTLLFFDAGNSWLHYSDIKLFRAPRAGLYTSAGFGFRIVVPGVGTIGFDFGYPFNTIEGQRKGWKPHFQIGTTFR
jgi:outer membrane protein insertion porin family